MKGRNTMEKIFLEDKSKTWEKCYVWQVINIPVGTRSVAVCDFVDPSKEDALIAWESDTEAIVWMPA